MTSEQIKPQWALESGDVAIGIELGSTRIKAVLVDCHNEPLASGSHSWEALFNDGLWTYSEEQIWDGLRDCYRSLNQEVMELYGVGIRKVKYMGVSAMMHGYLALNEAGEWLVPFRSWRNSMTGEAAETLTSLLRTNIPQRWSIAHLYQAILNQESHLPDIDFMTTLAGYVHWKLTDERVIGVGDAAGMFPVDQDTGGFSAPGLAAFTGLITDQDLPWRLIDVLPAIKNAGETAGYLTEKGARALDPTGLLEPGTELCPPEGDAGTGMVATNSVAPRTGNISAGTSIFAMVVLEEGLKETHREIDLVMTPDGLPVAMVHCNNGTGELDAWVERFAEFSRLLHNEIDKASIYNLLYEHALNGDTDAGGLVVYNYLSGEDITCIDHGRAIYIREQNDKFTLANFIRAQLMSIFATLTLGMEILTKREGVTIQKFVGHGGIFKTPIAAQRILAAALNVPISVGSSAGEGGAWGIAMLANYLREEFSEMSLSEYLTSAGFSDVKEIVIEPREEETSGYAKFLEAYYSAFEVQRTASKLSEPFQD